MAECAGRGRNCAIGAMACFPSRLGQRGSGRSSSFLDHTLATLASSICQCCPLDALLFPRRPLVVESTLRHSFGTD